MFATIGPAPQRLLIFTRLPDEGAVPLDALGLSTAETEIEVMWAPTPSANGQTLRRAFGDRVLAMQTGTTLGDRLSMAFSERFFFQRTEKIVAVASELDREIVDHAFALLESLDWVIGPANDGGYYLIGCRGPAFDSEVLTEGTQKIRQGGSTVALLPARDRGFE